MGPGGVDAKRRDADGSVGGESSDAQDQETDLGDRKEVLRAAACLRPRRARSEDLPLRVATAGRHRRADAAEELALERRRFGYRRQHVLLRRKGTELNHKKLFRLYWEERLTVKKRGGRKRALGSERP